MLHRTESEETTTIEAPCRIPAGNEVVPAAEAQRLPADQEARLAEWTACLSRYTSHRRERIDTVKKRHLPFTIAFFVIVVGWMAALGSERIPAREGLVLTLLGIVFVGAGLLGGLLRLWGGESSERERVAARGLAEIDDIRAVAPLLDSLQIDDKAMRFAVWRGLGRLLPRLTEDEACALGTERHSLLAAWMRTWALPGVRRQTGGPESRALVGVLHVFGHVGKDQIQVGAPLLARNAPLLPLLEIWASGKELGQDPVVQQAAIACRESIRQKLALARSGEQLLRASAPAPTGSDTLLRPIEGATQTDPQELLRPKD